MALFFTVAVAGGTRRPGDAGPCSSLFSVPPFRMFRPAVVNIPGSAADSVVSGHGLRCSWIGASPGHYARKPGYECDPLAIRAFRGLWPGGHRTAKYPL